MQPSDQNTPDSVPPNIQDVPQAIQPQQPIQPQVPIQEHTPVASTAFGSAPQSMGVSNDFQQRILKSESGMGNKKSILMIIGSIVGLVTLVVGGWFLMNFVGYIGFPLKEYSNDKYSVLVPESYKQTGDSDVISFEKTDANDGEESLITIGYIDVPSSIYKDHIESSIDESLTEEGVAEGIGVNKTIDNYKLEEKTEGNINYKIVTADVMNNGQLLGKARFMAVIGEDSVIFMMVAANKTETGLIDNMSKITDSLKLK